MKTYKCPNCFRRTDTDDSIVMIQCSCGYEMEDVQRQADENISLIFNWKPKAQRIAKEVSEMLE